MFRYVSESMRLFFGFLVAPGLLPFIVDCLVTYGVFSPPLYVHPRIFIRLLTLLYLTNIPAFFAIRSFGGGWVRYVLAGAIFPTLLLGLLLVLIPIPTEDEMDLALQMLRYCSLYTAAFGVASGLLFWMITERSKGGRVVETIEEN